MRNLLISLLLSISAYILLYYSGLLKMGEALVPALIVAALSYFILARRTFKRVEAIFPHGAKSLQTVPPRFDTAVKTLEGAYDYAPQQFGVRTQVDSQIGVILFLQKEFAKSVPYLQRALGFGHWMGSAMLAVVYYKKKKHDEMRKAIEVVTKRGKKQGLAWNLSAYLLNQIGERDEAIKILGQGLKYTKEDTRVKDALLALQNGKKIKMKAYKEQWYQFHLERPPAQQQNYVYGKKISKAQRRGR